MLQKIQQTLKRITRALSSHFNCTIGQIADPPVQAEPVGGQQRVIAKADPLHPSMYNGVELFNTHAPTSHLDIIMLIIAHAALRHRFKSAERKPVSGCGSENPHLDTPQQRTL
jgi:hypothetical protein